MPVVAIFAFIGAERVDGEAMFEFNQACGILGGFFVWIADFVLIIYPAFFWFVWEWFS
jgi:hypothetical protein